jgi:hypothetical protein
MRDPVRAIKAGCPAGSGFNKQTGKNNAYDEDQKVRDQAA